MAESSSRPLRHQPGQSSEPAKARFFPISTYTSNVAARSVMRTPSALGEGGLGDAYGRSILQRSLGMRQSVRPGETTG